MDQDTRRELDRIWAEIYVTQMVTARVAAAQFDPEEIERWHDRVLKQIERHGAGKPEMLADHTRSLDRLFVLLRQTSRRYASGSRRSGGRSRPEAPPDR